MQCKGGDDMNEEQGKYAIELLEYIAINIRVVAKVAQAAAMQYGIKPVIDPFEPKAPQVP